MTEREAWEHYVGLNWTDRFNAPEEPEVEKIPIKIDVDTSKLEDEEVTSLINDLEDLSYVRDYPFYGDCETTFEVNYDLEENRDEEGNEIPIVLIQLCGYCVEYYRYCKLADTLDGYNVNWTEK